MTEPETVIEIVVDMTGDRAEAHSPEAALVAARTLLDDANVARYGARRPTASFYVDGMLVRCNVTRNDLETEGT